LKFIQLNKFMKLLSLMKIFVMFFNLVLTKLAVSHIKNVVNRLSDNSISVENSIINPIYGYLFESTFSPIYLMTFFFAIEFRGVEAIELKSLTNFLIN
jgi:hypothetical protein